jgi:hypothetical protein
MHLFIHSMNNVKQSGGSLGFTIGLSSCSKFYLFSIIFTLLIRLYSAGLHYSLNNPLHYTVFGFCQEGDDLQQRWSMHVNEDGSSSYRRGTKRRISYKDITHLFVRKSLSFFLYLILIFFSRANSLRAGI